MRIDAAHHDIIAQYRQSHLMTHDPLAGNPVFRPYATRQRRVYDSKKCVVCLSKFIPNYSGSLFCSDVCRSAQIKRICKTCKASFYGSGQRFQSRKICSTQCRPKGKGAHNYKHGETAQHKTVRTGGAIRRWRAAVLKRADYKCERCGKATHLHAHHIKSFAKHPSLRTTLSNGMAVCAACHSEIHDHPVLLGRKSYRCPDCRKQLPTSLWARCHPCAKTHKLYLKERIDKLTAKVRKIQKGKCKNCGLSAEKLVQAKPGTRVSILSCLGLKIGECCLVCWRCCAAWGHRNSNSSYRYSDPLLNAVTPAGNPRSVSWKLARLKAQASTHVALACARHQNKLTKQRDAKERAKHKVTVQKRRNQICAGCCKQFTLDLVPSSSRKNFFCSTDCYKKGLSDRARAYWSSAAGKLRKQGKGKPNATKTAKCLGCKGLFTFKVSSLKARLYCSAACFHSIPRTPWQIMAANKQKPIIR